MELDSFKEYFILFGILLTFIATLLTLYNSRVNLKTTKYIETITSERIKWLEIIRSEYSELSSRILFSIKLYKWQIKNQEDNLNQSETINVYENFFDAETNIAFNKIEKLWSISDYIEKLTLFKLRLNPLDDIEIISDIDYFLNFYSKTEFLNEQKITEAEIKINKLTKEIQKVLKTEWEKCKKETKK